MSHTKLISGFSLACLAGVSMAGPAVTGTWTGHLIVSPPPNQTPEQKKSFTTAMEKLKKGHISLILKGDHTFVSDVTGMPQASHKAGKWSQKGGDVTLTTDKGSQTFKIGPDGKTMVYHVTPTIQVTFSR